MIIASLYSPLSHSITFDCAQHGSQLTKIDQFDHASNALHIALEATNASLGEVRATLEKENDPLNGDVNRKTKGLQLQVLHNLEAGK